MDCVWAFIGDAAQIFAGRLGLDGSVLDDEPEGLLLHPEPTVVGAVVAASTRTHSVLAWADDLAGELFGGVRVQRVLPHAPTDGLGTRAIGSIGALVAAEDERVAFVLTAPGLDPGTTVFSATNLPPGAELDAATGAFQWRPAPDESGLSLPAIHFAATDGGTAVDEDVAVDVVEAVASLGGTLRLGNGTPVAGAVLRVAGTAGGPRTVRTDAAGRFRFFDLAPRVYRVKLDEPTKKEFRATPGVMVRVVDGGDVFDADFVLVPR